MPSVDIILMHNFITIHSRSSQLETYEQTQAGRQTCTTLVHIVLKPDSKCLIASYKIHLLIPAFIRLEAFH
jgi:hypothetical protein